MRCPEIAEQLARTGSLVFLLGGAWSDGDTVAITSEVMKEGLWRVLLVLVLARAASSQVARAEASLAMEEDQKEDKM